MQQKLQILSRAFVYSSWASHAFTERFWNFKLAGVAKATSSWVTDPIYLRDSMTAHELCNTAPPTWDERKGPTIVNLDPLYIGSWKSVEWTEGVTHKISAVKHLKMSHWTSQTHPDVASYLHLLIPTFVITSQYPHWYYKQQNADIAKLHSQSLTQFPVSCSTEQQQATRS